MPPISDRIIKIATGPVKIIPTIDDIINQTLGLLLFAFKHIAAKAIFVYVKNIPVKPKNIITIFISSSATVEPINANISIAIAGLTAKIFAMRATIPPDLFIIFSKVILFLLIIILINKVKSAKR